MAIFLQSLSFILGSLLRYFSEFAHEGSQAFSSLPSSHNSDLCVAQHSLCCHVLIRGGISTYELTNASTLSNTNTLPRYHPEACQRCFASLPSNQEPPPCAVFFVGFHTKGGHYLSVRPTALDFTPKLVWLRTICQTARTTIPCSHLVTALSFHARVVALLFRYQANAYQMCHPHAHRRLRVSHEGHHASAPPPTPDVSFTPDVSEFSRGGYHAVASLPSKRLHATTQAVSGSVGAVHHPAFRKAR